MRALEWERAVFPFHGGEWPARWGHILGQIGPENVLVGCQAWIYPQIAEVHFGPYSNDRWMCVIVGNGTRVHPLYAAYISRCVRPERP